MILKNHMEEKQLNFNQPLLSVRRGSSTVPPPEVNKRKSENSRPNLPPLPYYKSDLKSGPVRNPGAVPFQWEQTPGRPKDEKQEQKETIEQPPLAPKLPPGRVMNHKQKPTDKVLIESPGSSSRSHTEKNTLETSSLDKALSELEGSEDIKEDEKLSSSEDENVTYVAARDTLSRTESFFFNSSISGVSGLDGPNIEPSAPYSDPQTRDFMMGRFLPAAKAMASETPLFASRKHSGAKEQPKPVEPAVIWNEQVPVCHNLSSTLPANVHKELEGEEEDEEEEVNDVDGYDSADYLSAKLCGLLPRFCLLNPIPGMRDHAQVISSVRSVRTRPGYVGVCSKSKIEDRTDDHLTCQYDFRNTSSLHTHFGHNDIASNKNGSPPYLGGEKGFLGLPKEERDFKDSKLDSRKKVYTKFKPLLADHSSEEINSLLNPAKVKTLYIDSEQGVDSQDSKSSSSGSRGRNPSVDYSLQDIKFLCGVDEKAVSEPKSLDTPDTCVFSSSEKSSTVTGKCMVKDLPKDQDFRLIKNLPKPQNHDFKGATQKTSGPLALTPLLPKSPSESWLSRTLPSMSSKNSSSKPYLGNFAFMPSPSDPKRERMMKTSNGQHTLFCHPGELAPIMEN